MINKRQIFYRGSLKSCNYTCEYCPFSKHISKKDLEKDEKELERLVSFCIQSSKSNDNLKIGAIQIVPYGEALIHEYYWRALAYLTQLSDVDIAGCQTNLSFPVEKMLKVFDNAGGYRQKLSLWCTYHPSMVSGDDFLAQCGLLEKEHISFCVGAVGVPENIPLICDLRDRLSQNIYMWINPMDGLKRPYTEAEKEVFEKVDIFFPYLLNHKKSKPNACKGCKGKSLFISSNGDITPCNISRKKLGNIYTDGFGYEHAGQTAFEIQNCGQRECSCFLAYSNRTDFFELACYGGYPAFRMPKKPQAMFFDVDGTLVKCSDDKDDEKIDEKLIKELAYWSRYSKIYLATSLPYVHAIKKCKAIREYLSGGVFANGGMICLFDDITGYKKIMVSKMEENEIKTVTDIIHKYPLKVKTYKHMNCIYKITAIGRKNIPANLIENLKKINVYVTIENNYLEITAANTGKLSAVKAICELYNYERDNVFVAGDSDNDKEMLEYYRKMY